jgi:hypothetical protein
MRLNSKPHYNIYEAFPFKLMKPGIIFIKIILNHTQETRQEGNSAVKLFLVQGFFCSLNLRI